MATFGDIIHNESPKAPLNHILIADGYRVENVSRDSEVISNRRPAIQNVIRYFESKKENYRIEFLLIDNDAPLSEESYAFAQYMDILAADKKIGTINYIGFSKCGVVGFDMIKYFKNPQTFAKTRIYSVSSPYEGTLMASPKAFMMEVRKIITAKLGENEFSTKVADAVEKKYRSVLSCSHMDLDIAIRDGVPDDMMLRYDPKFLKEIFSRGNIENANKVAHYQNICTRIDKTTLKNAVSFGHLLDLGLCIVNDVLFGGNSDGVVPYKSQSAIESHFDDEHSKSIIIPSTHNSLSHPLHSKGILDIVDENMDGKRICLK